MIYFKSTAVFLAWYLVALCAIALLLTLCGFQASFVIMFLSLILAADRAAVFLIKNHVDIKQMIRWCIFGANLWLFMLLSWIILILLALLIRPEEYQKILILDGRNLALLILMTSIQSVFGSYLIGYFVMLRSNTAEFQQLVVYKVWAWLSRDKK